MKQKKKLFTVGDAIQIGIFNAVLIVVYVIIYMAAHLLPGILSVFKDSVVSLFLALIYFVMAYKIAKPGIFTFNGLIFGIIWLLFGYPIFLFIGIMTGAILADAIAFIFGRYKNNISLVISYVFLRLGMAVGVFLPFYIWSKEASLNFLIKVSGEEYAETFLNYFTPNVFIIIVLVNIAAAVIGALIAVRIIKTKLSKTGLIS